MPLSSNVPGMIVSADNASVAGDIEVSWTGAQTPSLDPDPGDTVRLPTFERSAGIMPVAN